MDVLKDLVPSGNIRLDMQLQFTAVIDRMTGIARRTLLLDRSRCENDAEHSWHIAVMAMLFAEHAVVEVNVLHAVEMMLVHDLVEIYAGDTFAYDTAGYADKAIREQAAADKLFAILPPEQGSYIRQLWTEFESCSTPEARYADCLDKIQPFLHNTLTEGHTWQHSSPRPTREQVEKRISVCKDFMPELYAWAMKNIDNAIKQGWLINQ